MQYLEGHLHQDETVQYTCKISIKPAILLATVLAPFSFLFLYTVLDLALVWSLIGMISTDLVIYTSGSLVRFASDYAITNHRLISKRGIIRREIAEMELRLIESIKIIQSIPGRIFNYGSIIISGRGMSRVIFLHVNDPLAMRRKIMSKK